MSLEIEERNEMLKLYMEKASDSLEDAEKETNKPSTRVNRAYYSAFYCATALLLVKEVENLSSHKAVLTNFSKYFAKNDLLFLEPEKGLRDLEKSRYEADYQPKIEITEAKANECTVLAKNFYNTSIRELNKTNPELFPENLEQPPLSPKESAEEEAWSILGDDADVSEAEEDKTYYGSIISITDDYAIQRTAKKEAILHKLDGLDPQVDLFDFANGNFPAVLIRPGKSGIKEILSGQEAKKALLEVNMAKNREKSQNRTR
ncbi:hypothetical protein FACS1894187_21630 [Synergistales bacterium]|nr:hypothetical protein FACS1894187_21630 [Synergistales bacterium]